MNLARISSVIFMTTISILTGEKLENSNSSNICLLYYVIPVHYHIKLTLYMEKPDYWAKLLNIKNINVKNEYDNFYFHGESTTTINILQSTQYIKLHMLNLIKINRSTLNKNNGIIYALKTFTHNSATNIIEYYFFNTLSPGLYTLKMEFLDHFTENSAKNFFQSFYTNKENGIA